MDNQTKLLADLLGQSEFSLVDHYLRLLSKNYCVEQRVEILKERLIQTEILFSQEKKQYQQEIDVQICSYEDARQYIQQTKP